MEDKQLNTMQASRSSFVARFPTEYYQWAIKYGVDLEDFWQVECQFNNGKRHFKMDLTKKNWLSIFFNFGIEKKKKDSYVAIMD